MTRDSMDDLDQAPHSEWAHLQHDQQPRSQSTSCLDLTAHTDLARLRALLPSYRPAPDYETAVHNKYMQQSGAIIYSSQPEIHQPPLHEVRAMLFVYEVGPIIN